MFRTHSVVTWSLPSMLFVALQAGACTGSIPEGDAAGGSGCQGGSSGRSGGSSGQAGTTNDPSSNDTPSAVPNAGTALTCNRSGAAAGAAPLRRLTNVQYTNTLRDAFSGIATVPSVDLPEENVVGGYDNNSAGQTASLALIGAYQQAASGIATSATSSAATLAKLAPCASGANQETCGSQFITSWGRKLFRHPLSTDEASRLFALFKASLASDGYQAAISDTLQAMLLAPQFHYLVEAAGSAPDKEGFVALSAHEVAARMSYLLWNAPPDATLSAAADAGQLGDAMAVGKQVDRLMADDRAKPIVADFQRQWLTLAKLDKLDKNTTTFPRWSADVATSLRASVTDYIDHAFWNIGKLPAMLTDTHAFVDTKTAWIWGLNNAPSSRGLVDVGSGKRAGLLTQAGIMAAFAKTMVDSPVFRGLYVMRQFLCLDVGNPPKDVPTFSEIPASGEAPMTTRARQTQSHAAPTCASCHKLIDGIGFAFEHYDAAGAWRDQDNGIAVDATGELVGTQDVDGKYDGALELAGKLAKSRQVDQCVATHWFRYAFGRAETDDDDCALKPIVDEFVASGGDVKHLVRTIATSDAMRFRRAN